MNETAQPNQKIFQTLRNDLGHGDLPRSLRRDFEEFHEYMLNEEAKQRLRSMRPVKRWIVTTWWLLKSLFFKLTPPRRILFVIGIVFLFMSNSFQYNTDDVHIVFKTDMIGVVVIVFVLGLELKDKLLAHEELQAGQMVQQALMPPQDPEVEGWRIWLYSRSANDVGGDLVDFLRLPDSRFGVAIGDVAGKGLRAALLSAKLQATLRAVVSDAPSLAELGRKLNFIYSRDGLKNMFASLAYAEASGKTGEVKILNAGHMPPVVLRDGAVSRLEKGGPALGILADTAFAEQSVTLGKGESLIFYSDGLIEAQNVLGEFFGEQRLTAMLTGQTGNSAKQLGEMLVTGVDQFIGDARVKDDLSLVVLRRIA